MRGGSSRWIVAALATALSACAPALDRGLGPRPNIVLIVLDTVRPDMLSAYGYARETTPFLETFARTATRFERAYSVSCWTLPAHASLFTGVAPDVHGGNETQQRLSDSLPTLAERLASSGYETAGFSANVWVGARTGLERGFETFQDLARGHFRAQVDKLARNQAGVPEPPEKHYVAHRVNKWLRGRTDERPFFLFVNLVDAHTPYLPDWESARPFFGDNAERWSAMCRYFPDGNPRPLKLRHYLGEDPLGDSEWAALRALYEGALRRTDAILAALVRSLDQASPAAETLLVVLSDHGENLGDHGHFTHIFNLYDTNLRIPLLIRGPGFAPAQVRTDLVQITDLYPTLLGVAGLAPGAHEAARDLRAKPRAERVLRAALEYPRFSLHAGFPQELVAAGRFASHARALDAAVGARFKLIRASDGSEQLFDLVHDPAEGRPLAPGDAPQAALAALRHALGPPRPADGPDPAFVPAAAPGLEELRAMGYVGD